MNNQLLKGFIAGAIGAIILAIVMYIMKAAGMGEPGFVGMYQAAFGANPPTDQILGAIIFIISGGIWGLTIRTPGKTPYRTQWLFIWIFTNTLAMGGRKRLFRKAFIQRI